MFKDYQDLKKQSKAIGANHDAGASFADMNAKMASLNASMAAQTSALTAAPGDAVAGQVSIVSVGPPAGSMTGSVLVAVDVLVLVPGRPPVPASATLSVPPTAVHRVQPGVSLPARIGLADPTAFFVDWS